MNKILTKTVKKVTLLSTIMAILLAAAIVVTAIFGVHYGSTVNDQKTLTVTVNSFFYDTKLSDVEEICEAEFEKRGLDVSYVQYGEMSGDDCEIVYHFDKDADLTETESALETTFANKIENDDAWGNAFIAVASNGETTLVKIPISYFVRTACAVALFAALAFAYVSVRYSLNMGALTAACSALGSLMTAAVVLLARIPFTSSALYAIAFAALMTAAIVLLTLNRLRANMKAEKAAEQSAEELIVSSVAWKEIAALVVTLGAALVLVGAIATTAVRWFAAIALIALAVTAFVGTVFAPAMYLPMKKAADKRAAERPKNGYIGAKKSSEKKSKTVETEEEKESE